MGHSRLDMRKRTQNLRETFCREYEKVHENLTLSKETIFECFENVLKQVAQLEFIDAAVELTKTHNIKFTLLFPDNKVLMITKSLKPEDFDFKKDDIIFSLFVNKKLIATDVSEISCFISGFKKYLVDA